MLKPYPVNRKNRKTRTTLFPNPLKTNSIEEIRLLTSNNRDKNQINRVVFERYFKKLELFRKGHLIVKLKSRVEIVNQKR